MIQFYSPDIKEKSVLSPEESGHCVRVLRKKQGDKITVTDGKGNRYLCEILEASPRQVELQILEEENVPKTWDYDIILAVAPTKNADRMAWLVEKSTEVGVDRILFLNCKHSERKQVNVDRLRRNAISAMNQSLKTRLPEISETTTLKEMITHFDKGINGKEIKRYFGYCDANTERLEFVNAYEGNSNLIIAIGPEGDFSSEEVKQLTEAGYRAVTFGNERLRTETAALYGLTATHVISEIKRR